MRIDPSTNIFHDGIPGHYFQGVVSSRHPSPIRSQRRDRVKSEGWSTYWEEAAVQLGFYDDRPRSRELIYSFLRLRALRVVVDVQMALGRMSVDEAVAALMTVPMDRRIASEEADDFFAAPTGGIVYQVGKMQIERLLGERRNDLGADFDLGRFHDYVRNQVGLVPSPTQIRPGIGVSASSSTLTADQVIEQILKELDELAEIFFAVHA